MTRTKNNLVEFKASFQMGNWYNLPKALLLGQQCAWHHRLLTKPGTRQTPVRCSYKHSRRQEDPQRIRHSTVPKTGQPKRLQHMTRLLKAYTQTSAECQGRRPLGSDSKPSQNWKSTNLSLHTRERETTTPRQTGRVDGCSHWEVA